MGFAASKFVPADSLLKKRKWKIAEVHGGAASKAHDVLWAKRTDLTPPKWAFCNMYNNF